MQAVVIAVLAVFCTGPAHSQQAPAESLFKGQPLDYWIERAASKQWYEAKEALEVLGMAGRDGARVVPVVVKALRREELAVVAIQTLARLGEGARDAVPALIKALGEQNLRSHVVATLEALGEIARDAAPALKRLTGDPALRPQVLRALEALGVDPVPILARDLEDWNLRQDALERILARGSSARAAVSGLLKVLNLRPTFRRPVIARPTPADRARLRMLEQRFQGRKQEAGQHRSIAAQALGIMGPPAKAMRALEKALRDPDNEASRAAVWAMQLAGEKGVPALVKLLKSKRYTHALQILEGFKAMGPAGKGALPTLRRLARNADTPGGNLAGATIISIERALDQTRLVAAGDSLQRIAALRDLLPFGEGARDAIATAIAADEVELHRVLLDHFATHDRMVGGENRPTYPNLWIRPVASDVLRPLLEKCLRGEDEQLIAQACEAILRMGVEAAGPVVEVVRERAGEEGAPLLRKLVLAGCLVALGQDEGIDDAWIAGLPSHLLAGDQDLTADVLEVLGALGVRAETAVPHLVKLLANPSAPRKHIARTLARIGRVAVAPLVASLQEEAPEMRAWAGYALGMFGPEAAPALPALEKALGDGISEVREMAEQALRTLRQRLKGR